MLIKSIAETCGDVIECYEESQIQFLIDNSSNQKLPHNWKHLLQKSSAERQIFYGAGLMCIEKHTGQILLYACLKLSLILL